MLSLREIVSLLLIIYLMLGVALRTKHPRTPIWAVMIFAAFITVASGLIPVDEIGMHVDLNVIFFLIGMFSIVSMAEESGLVGFISTWFIEKFRSRRSVLIASSLLFGLMAAVAVNDTVALMGPPLAYLVARSLGVSVELAMLILMFSITIGSTMTPLGNPQNMMISTSSGMDAPFIYFTKYLAAPTIVNLLITPLILMKLYGVEERKMGVGVIPHEAIRDRRDAAVGGFGLLAALTLLVANDLLALMGRPHVEARGLIPMMVASGLYLFTDEPRRVLRGVDWGSIIFFIGMFITMDGIWEGGVLREAFQALMPSKPEGLTGMASITLTSLAFSQVLSNVPFVRLSISYMKQAGCVGGDVLSWMTLAMASTIAGNLTILGAASNVIVLEALESRYGATISFWRFLKYGSVVTAVNVAVYLAYLAFMAAFA
jgi:Na+/H+ antiporter NhaD/arsenite permease-like protein